MALLANQIWQCLDLDLLDGSEILAEQLVANSDTTDTRYLLANVQYRRGQYETAKLTCKDHLQYPSCSWVYAQSCLKLSQPEDGIKALERSRKFWDLGNDMPLPVALGRGELSPAAFHLLYAKLQSITDAESAVHEYTTSARLNPYLIENIMALCTSVRVKVKTETLFSRFEDPFNETNSVDTLNTYPRHQNVHTDDPSLVPPQTVTSTPRRWETPRRILSTPMAPKQLQPPPTSTFNGPSPSLGGPSLGGLSLGGGAPNASGIMNGNRMTSGHANAGIFQTPTQSAQPIFQAPSAAGRRQKDRVYSLSFKRSDQTSLSSLGKGIFTSPQHKSPVSASKTGLEALEAIIDALQLLTDSEFTDALTQLRSLAEPIRKTPFVLQTMGRLMLELSEYSKSVELYEELRNCQPDRTRGMEYMSTSLWHLKQDSNLSMLGYELTRKGTKLRREWQSWCALGNAFSVRHDTQNAIKCFQRAVTINPKSEYAYTLMGYEYVSNEELENATNAFAKALQVNPQHYNAWYGLGSVHYSLGQYSVAEIHFTQAIRLNPNNPVLQCFLGAVLEARGKYSQALVQFEQACRLDPSSPMPRFRKAEALLDGGMYKEALNELLEIDKLAPEDPTIHFAIGKAHKGLGEGELAVQRFTGALQLAPKMSSKIRRELDSM